MATPVKDIFEPRITKIGIGSYLRFFSGNAEPVIHILNVHAGLATLISLRNGHRWARPIPVVDENSLTIQEVNGLVGGPEFLLDGWSVLSRAEAAAELAKMK